VNDRQAILPVLSDVTLVAITSVAIRATVDALQASMERARFGEILLLSDQPPPAGTPSDVYWRQIERLASRADYSRFMLCDLAQHIDTSHALCVQWDGFVVNGGAWDPEFLRYDYIGAVWPHFQDGHNVGNGGFSLRSKRLLEACRELPFDGSDAEDLIISRRFRPQLEERGIRFAPESIARRFAFERTAPTGREFGFHGAYNLARRVSPDDAARILRHLDPGMLARNEVLELLWWALTRGRLRLAATMIARLRMMRKPDPGR
jgi:hypothetical protein